MSKQNNARTSVDIVEVEPGVYSVLVDGRSYTILAGEGTAFRDPRDEAPNGGEAARGGRQQIVSPMPGKVVRVLVENGASVEKGQGIVVVEAMKMQNEMPAPRTGTVSGIRVSAGATVAAGEVLATIE